MKQRYYFSHRSDNYQAVMVFTTRCGANKFTQARREAYIETYITWDMYSKVMTRKEAINNSSNGKIYTDWRVAARERIAGFV